MTAVAAAEEEEVKEGEVLASRPTKSRRVTLARPSSLPSPLIFLHGANLSFFTLSYRRPSFPGAGAVLLLTSSAAAPFHCRRRPRRGRKHAYLRSLLFAPAAPRDTHSNGELATARFASGRPRGGIELRP